MKKLIITAVLSLIPLQFIAAADRVGDFALLDQEGTYHQLSWYSDHKAVVLLTQSNGCAATQQAIPEYKSLRSRFDAQGIEFMMLNPEGVDRELVKQEAANFGMDFPILMDDTQLVGELLNASHAGEAIVLDPESHSLLYRGPVDTLSGALASIAAGESVNTEQIEASGCAITYAARDAHDRGGVSYSSDVAPIIAENCADCHRQGGIAPFALDSHQVVQGWAPMIREVLMTKRMPPGQVDPHVGNVIDMSNLNNDEMQKLVHWIDAGAPVDGETDLLANLTWPDTKWRSEPGTEPDLIVSIPPQEIPATGVVDYLTVYADIPLQKDTWIRGSEIVPGDYSVLHHVITRVVPPGVDDSNVRPDEGDDEFAEQANSNVPLAGLSGYVPGRRPSLAPKSGGLLRAGSRVSFQMHYTTSGKEVTDQSELGIYFYPEGVVPEIQKTSGGRALHNDFLIPPNAKDYEVSRSAMVEKDAYLISFMPHMHFRGKRMEFVAKLPDGTEKEILSVPNYQFNWQIRHHIDPMFVPAGTEIVATGAFDNSPQNPYNPDPQEAIDWGPQSWDEMFIGYMRWQHLEDVK
ncbi:MAG: redoxin domain-containing protein [Pseudohongiellaceae bacterium]